MGCVLMTTVTFSGWHGMISLRWLEPCWWRNPCRSSWSNRYVTTEGIILCLNKSSCDKEGIIPCWWMEAFPSDREWLFWRESSCNMKGTTSWWWEAFPDDREWFLGRESSCDMDGTIPWWWEAFSDDREWFLWTESSCVWRNHRVTWREPFPDRG